MMKKIIILTALAAVFSSVQAFAACPINQPGFCKADIGSGINDTLQDKILPNNLQQTIQPNNTFNNRTQLGQPHVPDNINMEPVQEEINKPYDANCQFGNCINRGDIDSNKNK